MTTALPSFDDMAKGKGCPFCAPRPDVNEFSFKVADMSASTLYLDREQIYRGYCILVFRRRHTTGIEQLAEEEYQSFMRDLHCASQAVAKTVKPDHMNYATLGNGIPHLHYHIIPRYKGDPKWGAPVWPTKDTQKIVLQEQEYMALAEEIRASLRGAGVSCP